LALAVLTFTGSATASATPITYTEEGVVSGFLGGFSGYGGEFFAGDMIISWTGDTTNVMQSPEAPDVFFNLSEANAVSVSIANYYSGRIIDGRFIEPVAAIVYQFPSAPCDPRIATCISKPSAGFVSPSGSPAGGILLTYDEAFSTYALTTAIGPITNEAFPPTGEQQGFPGPGDETGNTFLTTAGYLTLFAGDGVSTFTASPTPVPEPSSLTLLGLGLAGMGARRWRQRKA
jgi:hypothetical protein